MHLMLSCKEPWDDKNSKSILDFLYFSKNKVPFIKKGYFPISNKIKNLDIRIFLRNALEMNQLKRYNFKNVNVFISKYFHNFITKDLNFEIMQNKIKYKGVKSLNILRKLYLIVMSQLLNLNNQFAKSNPLE